MKETKFKQTEVGLIPSDWEVKTLEEICSKIGDIDHRMPESVSDGIPYLMTGDFIGDCELDFKNAKKVSFADYEQLIKKIKPEQNDIIFARYASIGAVRIVETPKPFLVSYSCAILKIRDIYEKKFIYYSFFSDLVKKQEDLAVNTGTQANIGIESLKKICILLPPLEEQKRIAQALSDVDSVISTTEKLIAKKKVLKQGTMQQLLTGKVRLGFQTKDERRKTRDFTCHSGAEGDRIQGKYKMTELGLIPEDWRVKRLGDEVILSTETFESAQYKKEFYVGTENMLQDKAGITKNETVNPIGKAKGFKRNDILMSNIRPYLKKIWYANRDGICSNDVLVYRVAKNAIDSSFLYSILSDDKFFAYVMENAVGTKMPRGDKKIIREYLFACPPTKEEQTAIATVLSDMDAEIAALETKLAKYRQLKTGMMQQLLTGKVRLVDSAETVSENQSKHSVPLSFKRSVLAAEIADRLCDEPTFGHVKMEKMLFLTEKMCHIDIDSSYHRDAAGPFDNRALRSVDSQLEKQKWFKFIRSDKGNHYIPLEKRGGHSQYFDRYYSECRSVFDNIINTFKTAKTEQCEIVATLYSAWEDFLNHGTNPTDDQIVTEVLTNWNESKKRISKERWIKALSWMKENSFVPRRT